MVLDFNTFSYIIPFHIFLLIVLNYAFKFKIFYIFSLCASFIIMKCLSRPLPVTFAQIMCLALPWPRRLSVGEWFACPHIFCSHISMSFCLKYVSYKEHRGGIFFFLFPTSLTSLVIVERLSPLTFNLITCAIGRRACDLSSVRSVCPVPFLPPWVSQALSWLHSPFLHWHIYPPVTSL